jgi:hypothetical protein
MGPINASKIAAKAEINRFQAVAKRQGIRAAFGILTVVFALGVLALLNVVAYELLRLSLQPLFASLIVLIIDLAIAAICLEAAIGEHWRATPVGGRLRKAPH